MKKFRFFLSLCLIMVAATASAQFANGSKKGSSAAVNTDSYQRFYVSYNPLSIKPDWDGAEDINLTGFAFGFTKGISISKSLPLFVEAGARLQYGFKSEDESESGYWSDGNYQGYPGSITTEYKDTYMGVVVPVNLAYKWTPSSSPVSITPFFGITLKGNIIAKQKVTRTEVVVGGPTTSNEKEYDYFDKDEVGKDGQWSRFQAGWQIGVGIDYKQLYVGFHYGSDFGEVCKKTKTSNWAVSVGFNF